MGYLQEMQESLEIITSVGTQLLQYLKSHPTSDTNCSGLPSDPFDGCPKDICRSRKELATASATLLQLGTRPEDYIDHLQSGYQNLSCIRWLVNLDILTYIPHDGSISYNDLAIKAGVPWIQLRGVARMAICNGFLEEPKPNHVRHSRISAIYARDESFLGWARWMLNYSVPTAFKFADATQKWGDTVAKDETAFNLGLEVEAPFFDHLRKTAAMTDAFAGYMRNVTSNETWSLEHAVSGYDWGSLPRGAKVVDIGGSHGHCSVAIAKKFEHLEFVVQDLPETIASARKEMEANTTIEASVKARIMFMENDFFKSQPINDADIYFLRMICHDWPDAEATTILSHTRAAMKPGAQIVIMETILPQPGTIPGLQEQQLRVRDLTMMQVFNAKERELEDWRKLLHASGLQIANIKQPRDSVMGLLTIRQSNQRTLPRMNTLEPHDLAAVPVIVPSQVSALPTQSLSPPRKPVLIMGAGISGLCLAQALKKAGIDFRVFERDPAIDSRPQGYRLKLEGDAAKALKDCLTSDAYKAFETSCALTRVGETDLNPFNGTVVHSRSGGGLSLVGKEGLYASYTVDRRAFRTQLMTGIEDNVVFGKDLVSHITNAEDGDVVVMFKDGTSVEGSFLVGADGLRSAVRRQCVPDHHLVDTGAICVYGKTTITPEIVARFPEKGMRWMTVVSDSAPMLQSCLIGDSPITLLVEPIRWDQESRARHPDLPQDYLYWALIGRKERFDMPETMESKSESPAAQSAKLSLAVTEEWHPSIRALFELQEPTETSTIRVASTCVEIAPWKAQESVTFLGDAIHPMSPCGGVGANTAIVDAAALAQMLSSGERPTLQSVAEFEAGMRKRALRNILRSEIGSKKMFGQKSLQDCPKFEFGRQV